MIFPIQTKILLSLFLLLTALACNQPVEHNEIIAPDTIVIKATKASSEPIYFDYSKTRLTDGYNETAYAKFSNDSTEDIFTIKVNSGNLTETKTTLRIITNKGEIIYEHIFETTDLINGYALSDIKSDTEMEKYVLMRAKSILKDGLYHPDALPKNSYLNEAAEEDFENYDVFMDIKTTEKNIFHYCLNEESHYYLGYSDKLKKVVPIIYCC